MEGSAADASARAAGEDGFGDGSGLLVEEAKAAEEVALGFAEIDVEIVEIKAEESERAYGVGHQAFAAGLVDGWLHGVDDFDVKALVGGCDGAGETGGARAYDEDVRLRCWGAEWHEAGPFEDMTPLE
jgi:hypothetical protein